MTTPASFQALALSQRIDQLSGTKLSNISVSGVAALTAADIPTNIVAANYLPLAGGAIAGNLSVTGNFTVSGTQSLSGAITVPYLTAIATTGTSTFAGAVGIGTITPAYALDVNGTIHAADILAKARRSTCAPMAPRATAPRTMLRRFKRQSMRSLREEASFWCLPERIHLFGQPDRQQTGSDTAQRGYLQFGRKSDPRHLIGIVHPRIAHAVENNSPSKGIYAGTGAAILVQSPVDSTPIFGATFEGFEVDASGSAVTSASAVGIAVYGARENVLRNVSVYNFKSGIALYFTGNGWGNGFGASNSIIQPYLSTNGTAIKADGVGGSASTYGSIAGDVAP